MKDLSNPGGAMTGATGDLTPDDTDEEFVPGERREVSGTDAEQGSVTYHQATGAPAQRGDVGDPGAARAAGGFTNLAERESGYGSEHGLSPNDDAYRMEVHPPAGHHAEEAHRREAGDIEAGVDETADREERF
ncbi:MAG TPA: hypothetical protein VHR55_02810 [Candidatus Limnocylindria bacterium]|nr:hypothetical protein [Candidatus Limnocylindria bacterium]